MGPGDTVGLLFENCPELLACVAAVAKLGAVAGMLNPKQRGAVLSHSMRTIQPRLMVIGDGCLPALHSASPPQPDSVPRLWAGMGPGCLIYLAALKGIPDELYEAADMDGASFTDKILFVVIPTLRPLLIINFVGVFIAAWQAEANILAMTAGGANTEVAGLHIFYKAFIFLRLGPATAAAWMLGCLLVGFTLYQLRILSRVEFRANREEK